MRQTIKREFDITLALIFYTLSQYFRLKKRVAIKCMKFQFESSLDALRLSRELKILMNSSHPNIVKLYEVVLPNTSASTSNFSLNFKGGHIHNIIDQLCEIHLVMEFVETDLYRIIGSDQYISEGHVKYFLKQIVLATAYLHNSGVIHRDIKPANILVVRRFGSFYLLRDFLLMFIFRMKIVH